MAEAAEKEGQFSGMPDEFVRCKINDLLAIIDKHQPDGLYLFLDWDDYRTIIHEHLEENFRNPYHLLFPGIFDLIAAYQRQKGIFPEPIDVDFDEQGSAGQFAQGVYPMMKANCDEDTRKMLGRIPLMLNDKNVMPLQAADMLAWNVRREHDMDDDGIKWHWLFEELNRHVFTATAMPPVILESFKKSIPPKKV